jgi:polyphosphate kinase
MFHNDGKPEVFIGSADLMARNLDYRVEVAVPIVDVKLKKQLIDIIELQWSDNVKARIFDATQSNTFKTRNAGEIAIRSQDAVYDFLKRLSTNKMK